MSNYVFKFPQNVPPMTYAGLAAYLGSARTRAIGSTVLARHNPATWSIDIYLYGSVLAQVTPDTVTFPADDNPGQASREWISRIIADNHLGGRALRVRRVLCIDGSPARPVHGRTWAVKRDNEEVTTP